jgi:hypothetical protein
MSIAAAEHEVAVGTAVSGGQDSAGTDVSPADVSPAEVRPSLVGNVEAGRQVARSGQPYVVIHNPAAHTYLKLGVAEFDLLPLLDGSRTLTDLALAWYERHGTIAPARIVGLVEALRENGFIDEPADSDGAGAAGTAGV